MKYIALLRGINVSGKNRIRMNELVDSFQALQFKNVKTYIQSGNVVFDYDVIDTKELACSIKKKINEDFGFTVKVLIRTKDEMENIINSNPFIKESNVEIDKLHITFLESIPDKNALRGIYLKKEENEKYLIISKEIYLYCPNGYGRTKLTNAIFEKKLKTIATTRNWKTVNRLFGIANK
ncbi:DUF1697 domain-containing protein [Clostridium arbusti]|uniref:DUF1697 domain-containing protein n=1 Tax=Clostridium arbusti TaxID=1137848 RepID=UPI00028834A5|nr:DUF1697 domain-containing protein [Clostridium arbusti]